MLKRAHATLLVTLVAGLVVPLPARADMYVWADKAGVTHVSNLPPPDGVRLVGVTRAQPKDPSQEAALRDAARQAELRALNERVQQLQAEVEQARRDPPRAIMVPQQPYAPSPPAPYVIVVAPPAPPAAPLYAEPAGCDFAWGGCGFGYWPGFYSATIVVESDRRARHPRPVYHAPPRRFGGLTLPPAIHLPQPVYKPGHWRK